MLETIEISWFQALFMLFLIRKNGIILLKKSRKKG